MKTSPDLRSAEDQGSAVRTFLIADIRGYSTYTRERGHAEAAVLAARFVDLAQDAVEARGGRIVEVRGDEVLAVFGTPLAAVRAGVDLQLACAEEAALDPDLAIPAGVGIDQGESVREGEHYHGSALNLAARLCSVASAGEVLVTKSVAEQVSAHTGLEDRDRGACQFKGFDAPVEVVVITSRSTPAPQIVVLEPPSIPPELDTLTPMVGRDRDLRWLRGIWRQVRRGQGRVVFVSGPPRHRQDPAGRRAGGEGPVLGWPGVLRRPGRDGHRRCPSGPASRAGGCRPVLLVLDDFDAGGKDATRALVETSASFGDRSIMALALVTDPEATPEISSSVNEEGIAHRRLAPLGLDEVTASPRPTRATMWRRSRPRAPCGRLRVSPDGSTRS